MREFCPDRLRDGFVCRLGQHSVRWQNPAFGDLDQYFDINRRRPKDQHSYIGHPLFHLVAYRRFSKSWS